MRKKIVIRDCKKSELEEVQELMDELYITDAGPSVPRPDISKTYKALKAKPDKGRLLVFDRDGELLGYVIIIFFWSNEYEGDIVDIDEILVKESARGEGVGHAFFKWLKSEYENDGVVGWSLQVRPRNRKAARLYNNLGFLASSNVHMYNMFCWSEAKRKKVSVARKRR